MRLVHIYRYEGGNNLMLLADMDAHAGRVNDVAFCYPDLIATCGEDGKIKIYNAATGCRRYLLRGHRASVNNICPRFKESMQFIVSSSTDGKMKAWSTDDMASCIQYNAPTHASTAMTYGTDGTRLFMSGQNMQGGPYIGEWCFSRGIVKHTYEGLGNKYVGKINFDSTRNQFLAAGDQYLIKYWDINSIGLLTTADAGGNLPASACLRFNKVGNLLAVSTNDERIKILANKDGARLLNIDVPTVASTSQTCGMTTNASTSVGPRMRRFLP